MSETIEVLFVMPPDGNHAWLPVEKGVSEDFFKRWRESLTDEQRADHEGSGTLGGVMQIRMLKSDYDKIPMKHWEPK